MAKAQKPTETMVVTELKHQGYDPNRFKEEMLKRGVNPETINPDNPVEVERARKVAEEVMALLDAEKHPTIKQERFQEEKPQSKIDDVRSSDKPENLSEQPKDVQKAVGEGATVEEAISEKEQENINSKLPKVTTYGQHIFRDKSLKLFRTAEDAKPPKSYVLGPGDKVAVSIWGATEENFSTEIQKDGYIQPSRLPRYYLAGLTIEQAENLLYTRLRNYYYFTRETFELSITTARTLSVNIVGEVFNNGSYNVSAVNTALNALVAAGGPTDIGSVRKIHLMRAGKKPVVIDVYKYLQNPLISQDLYLSDNDYIYVPVAEKKVSIEGAINRKYQYELIEGEGLKELIAFAGGFKAEALKSNIHIRRIDGDVMKVIDIDWTVYQRENRNFELKNGDEITVREVNPNIKNEISVSGAVENPGKYALQPGDRISDLLKKGRLSDNAITTVAYLKRYNDDLKTIRYQPVNIEAVINDPNSADNIVLNRGDELVVSSKASFSENYEATITGEVRNPHTFDLDIDSNIRVSDAVFFAGGLKEDAITDFAYIFRTKMDEAKTIEYIKIDLQEALKNPGSTADVLLSPMDRIVVYSQNNYTDESFVRVAGAVREPGEFLYNPSLTLTSALILSGGLKQEAARDRIDVYRLEFNNNAPTRVLVATIEVDVNLEVVKGGNGFILMPFDQIYVRTVPEFELQRNIQITGEVRYPGTYALLNKNTKLGSIINSAGGITEEAFISGATLYRHKGEEGYVIINLEKALKKPKSHENLILQEGDEIFIPKMDNIVMITGATLAAETYPEKITKAGKIQVPYRKGKNAMYYIDEYAGGLSKEASKSRISVIDASGKVTKAKGFLFFRSYPKVGPGSEITVGTKPKKAERLPGGEEKEDVKWGEILANSIAQATAILSLILLIQNVN